MAEEDRGDDRVNWGQYDDIGRPLPQTWEEGPEKVMK